MLCHPERSRRATQRYTPLMRLAILNIPIDCLSFDDAIAHIGGFFRMDGQFHIATPNPEMLVEARSNAKFREVLQKTALNVPDGAGLTWAMRRVAPPQPAPPQRIPGADLLQTLCSPKPRICPPERIFLLGAAPGIAERAAVELKERNHLLKEIGTFSGSPREEDEAETIERINAFQPTLLFVAFGAPKQELWIARNLPKLKTVKVAMGVGGAFDFLAGKRRRAPVFLRKVGLEWLWRLILEPRRIKRIWNAVVVFPWLVMTRHAEERT
jgi:N-acetylglucosaminyldiphosphoundecaprenol N-acetyl-beta-D-mannosaminyltransferase